MIPAEQWWEHLAPYWMWHPLGQCAGTLAERHRCESYNWHSGLEANVIALIALVPLVVAALLALRKLYKHLECHEADCSNPGLVVLPGGTRTCHKHDPRHGHEVPPPGHVKRMWEDHLKRIGDGT